VTTRPSIGGLPPRRPSPQREVIRLAEAVRREAAAFDAGRRLRRTGRVSLPVRTRAHDPGARPR
jgi:hypothetical protein